MDFRSYQLDQRIIYKWIFSDIVNIQFGVNNYSALSLTPAIVPHIDTHIDHRSFLGNDVYLLKQNIHCVIVFDQHCDRTGKTFYKMLQYHV